MRWSKFDIFVHIAISIIAKNWLQIKWREQGAWTACFTGNSERNPLKQRLIDIEYLALNKYVTSINQCVPEIYVIFTKQVLLDPVK